MSWFGPVAAQVADAMTIRPVLVSMAMMDQVAHAGAGMRRRAARAQRRRFMGSVL
jgi:hypothetical protein